MGNNNNLFDGMVIGGSMFNVIIGFSFMNKIIMNLYTIFSITIYQFTTEENKYQDMFFFTFTAFFIFISSCKEYLQEKHRVRLYTCSKQNNYVGDQIIAHTPVGILATKFDDSQMKFELISMNAKAQQLLHLESNQNSLDNFLKQFEIDSEQSFFNRSDLSNKQTHSKEQLNNQKKKQENEMSLLMQCKFQMMKMQPAYPRDLSQRFKKRNNSNGKSNLISGFADKETDVTAKNNINTHSVIAEVKQFNGFYNSMYLNLQISTYTMMGQDKYAIFCINPEPYKRDYYTLKNKNQKYQNFFSNFCSSFEKSLISQIKDWKCLYSDFLSVFAHSIISPSNSYIQTNLINNQQNCQQQHFGRQAQTKKTLNLPQAEQKHVKPFQKNLQISDIGNNQSFNNNISHKQINNTLEENAENILNNLKGSQYSILCSPLKETKQQQFFQTQDNNYQQGSMNFDYFNLTQESMNNIQPFYNQIQNFVNNIESTPVINNNFSPKAGNNLFLNQNNTLSIPLNIQSPKSVNFQNNRIKNLIFRVNYNNHRLMYDYQNWNALYDLEFGQNVLINQRQAAEQIDLDKVITKIISIFEVLIIEKQIKIIKQIKVQSIQITQNSKKVHIILYNVLHNAFLYCKYQSSIQITISDNQNCANIQIINEIHQDEENQIAFFLQNQLLQDSKNLLPSVNLDTLNQFSQNFQQGSDQQAENGNSSNNSIHIAFLARKKGESYGLKLSKFLLKSIGQPDKLKCEVKDQKFTVSLDIFLDVNYQRKKQTSLFQRYKKNSTHINNDPNQSINNQQSDAKQIFETVYYSPTEYQKLNNFKKADQNIIQNEDITINVNSIDEYPNKEIVELDDAYKKNDIKSGTNEADSNLKNKTENQKDNELSSFNSDIQDISEQQQSNLQVNFEQSQITASFNHQAKIKTLKFQTMQKKI
ncbi:transmembrane protein, putative (macronuclear) [Tetrahymena thermophila SB210]|uniref:Transmembrane protein, putative n=1 Tax=Tetrahymena thermophila (strain SB210) TaxID=312017 RepID=I7MAC7_TETTS|nr:transmembrane protein, putative [Tetrahymena thermophila SB210]EAS04331.2 transmembrane protein, putative [Tetrahymena thermophila SB210]|eukprot:XP_001024576.2 transmembrane protein, putative [Tetrahymena thermophila SB210]